MTEMAPPAEPPAGRTLAARRRALAVVIALVVAVTVAAVVASTRIKSPAQAAADTAPPPPSTITAPVERRVLTDTVVTRGTVAAEQSVDLLARAGAADGVAVITGLDVEVGDSVEAGKRVAEVSGRPVFVLRGAIPIYRDLRPGSEGRDVTQLQEALKALGFSSGDRAGRYGEGTKRAVTRFYQSRGYVPRPAGEDDEEAVEAAELAVTTAERALRDARAALKAVEPGASTETARVAVSDREDDLAHARDQLADVRADTGPMVPAGEVVYVADLPARVDGLFTQVGAQPTAKIMTLSSGRLVVRGELSPFQSELVRAGQPAQILAELSGITAEGTVKSVAEQPAPPAEPAQDGAAAPATEQIGFIVTPTGDIDAKLAGQNVRITVTAASSGEPVLVVPLAAVSAGADGKTTVTVAGADGERRVEVTAGASGEGYVQVTPVAGGELAEGDRVVVGR